MAGITLITILVLAALVAGIAIGLTAAEIKHMRERIATLETAQAKRMPYHSIEEIENGFAALNAIEFKLDFEKDCLENAKAHFGNARNGRG